MRTRLIILACIFMTTFLLHGCGKKEEQPAKGKTDSRPAGKPAELTLEQARTLATRLANEAFAKKQLVDAGGKTIPTVKMTEKWWRVGEKKSDRWIFRCDPPEGIYAIVSFDLNGNEPKVDAGFAPK